MGYSALASSIKSKQTAISDSSAKIEAIDFDAIWSGGAHDKLTSSLKKIISNLKAQEESVSTFCTGLILLDTYKKKKTTVATLINTLNFIPNDEEHAAERSMLKSEINKQSSQLDSIKPSIIRTFESISTISPTDVKPVTITYGDLNYMFDLDEIKAMYDNGLKKLADGESLYKYYDQYDENGNLIVSGKDYVEGLIQEITKNYSGREASVNAALAILQLAADKGVKLDYEHKGTAGIEPYVPTAQVASGVDCNPFVSWMVDKGTPGGFQWRPVGEFKNVGEKRSREDWVNAQPGDVAVNNGHVTMIIENNPEEGKVIIAHASGGSKGIITSTLSYNYLASEGYQIQDMTNVYNGTENTNRKAFDQYVNWETYKRKV